MNPIPITRDLIPNSDYRKALRTADVDPNDGNNSQIDESEAVSAAQELSKLDTVKEKFSGATAADADKYLRSVLGLPPDDSPATVAVTKPEPTVKPTSTVASEPTPKATPAPILTPAPTEKPVPVVVSKPASRTEYETYVTSLTGDPAVFSAAKTKLITMYDTLLTKEGYRFDTPNGLFIKDPSQGNKIVSEGQGFWMNLSPALARINPAQAKRYQGDFDQLLKATDYMIKLAKDNGNPGQLPAWKVKISGDTVVLGDDPFSSDGKAANSASDADMDIIRGLVEAQSLVNQGIWADKGYGKRALELIAYAQNNLFARGIMKYSEEPWGDQFLFTDYLSPATCMEIAKFLEQNKKDNSFWVKAASDSMKIYDATLTQTGEFPEKIKISSQAGGKFNISSIGSHQTWDGIRSPWRIGDYLIGYKGSEAERGLASKALAAADKKYWSFTGDATLDRVMYLPTAIAAGDSATTRELWSVIKSGPSRPQEYFQNTLYMLGLATAFFPETVDASVAATKVAPVAADVVEKPKGITGPVVLETAAAQWGKGTNVSLVNKNTVKVSGTKASADLDFIDLGVLKVAGHKKLQIKVTKLTGAGDWGGKVFALKMNGVTAVPQDGSISGDGNFIEQKISVGDTFLFDLSGKTSVQLGLNVLSKAGMNYELEFSFVD